MPVLKSSAPWPGDVCTSPVPASDRKSTRLNSSHVAISYAVFCLKKQQEASDRESPRLQPFEESSPAHAQGGCSPRHLRAMGFSDHDELVAACRRRFHDRGGTTAS